MPKELLGSGGGFLHQKVRKGVGLKGATDVECRFIHLGVTKEVVGVVIVIQKTVASGKLR